MKNNSIKENLLLKINSLKTLISVIIEDDLSISQYNKILTITKHNDGIVLIDNSLMLNSNGNLILDIQGNSELDNYIFKSTEFSNKHNSINYTLKNPDKESNSISLSNDDIRKISTTNNEILKVFNISIDTNISPFVSHSHFKIKSKDIICQKAIALAIIASVSDGVDKGVDIKKISTVMYMFIKDFSANNYFTQIESNYLNDTSKTQNDLHKKMLIKFESAGVLLWSLNNLDKITDPTIYHNKDQIMHLIFNYRNYESFLEKTKLLHENKIFELFDLYYKFNYFLKTQTDLQATSSLNNINPNIVNERFKALSWIVNYKNLKWYD